MPIEFHDRGGRRSQYQHLLRHNYRHKGHEAQPRGILNRRRRVVGSDTGEVRL
jgi:hypothetical protein